MIGVSDSGGVRELGVYGSTRRSGRGDVMMRRMINKKKNVGGNMDNIQMLDRGEYNHLGIERQNVVMV
jgi:hypothetical protein